jgi:hypothetical protein
MASRAAPQTDWRDESAYAHLLAAEPSAFAWEWLRRDSGYRQAAAGVAAREVGTGSLLLRADPAAAPWGLHAFEAADLNACRARPVWRADPYGRVLAASAEAAGPWNDRFELERYGGLATVVQDVCGSERILISDGALSLRMDVEDGTMLHGPVRLAYRLAGLEGVERPLETLRRLLSLWRTGRFVPPRIRNRNPRLILMLRAADALAAGTTQREIASVLLSREPTPPRWRTEEPSLRMRAQRLAKGARAMVAGGYRSLLQQ